MLNILAKFRAPSIGIITQFKRNISGLGMFCYQCEQTRHGKFCSVPIGVCRKKPDVAALQDMTVELGKRVATYAYLAKVLGFRDKSVDRWIIEAYFATLTNVNFDPARFGEYLKTGAEVLKKARDGYFEACTKNDMTPEAIMNGDWDITCMKQFVTYGLKGGCAYLHHAMVLGYEDQKLYEELERILYRLTKDLPLDEVINLALQTGKWNYRVMELLDKANTGKFGHPEITHVRTTPVKGKCIVVSGHDLRDLDLVLQQTEGKNINVYTHGEMLPCNAYPGLKRYKHLIGNYGTAWQRQFDEFEKFPGSILMTTNCMMPPKDSYAHRFFTRTVVGFPKIKHIKDDNMSELIEAAEKESGFTKDEPKKEIVIGFGHETAIKHMPILAEAVKKGAIKRFFVIGGCDGHELERTYYTDFAKALPKDCAIITMACGKFRFNMLDLGNIEFEGHTIPRVIDAGQCNDTYSAIRILKSLSETLEIPISDLPVSYVLSWFEQKMVAVLLTLFSMGIKMMFLGPQLPGFMPPNILNHFMTNYDMHHISDPKADMRYLFDHAHMPH